MTNNILSNYQRSKIDNNDDSIFYCEPKLVNHLDYKFRNRLTNLYREMISNKSIILDLMSSWISHLPTDVKYERVIGHGLNLTELQKNKRLDSYWIQDLNKNQKLPLKDSSIDVCLIVAGWQYLQYPEKVAFELKRILRHKGKLIISFSNRAFWNKTPQIWREGSDFDHIKYVDNVLVAQGWPEPKHIAEENNKKMTLPFFEINSDPFFSVIATNQR